MGKTNMVEAREAGAVKEAQLFDGQDTKFSLTASGDRFRDIVLAHPSTRHLVQELSASFEHCLPPVPTTQMPACASCRKGICFPAHLDCIQSLGTPIFGLQSRWLMLNGLLGGARGGNGLRQVVGTGAAVQQGSSADIRYRVLRLGKRSRDGPSLIPSDFCSLRDSACRLHMWCRC